MSNKKETALTEHKSSGFLQLADVNMAEMMTEELDGLDMSFERIKIPSAGSTVFEVPGENPGEPDTVKEFSAVILYHHPLFAYYKSKYTGGNNPPDCGSFDGITGEGDPGGSCKTCPYNKFGSGENGSKACKNRRRIFVLREGEIFPLLLSLPTGSLKEFTKYIKRLLGKGRKSNSVVTRFSLRKATNSGGIAYSQAQFAIDRVLTPQEYALLEKLSEQVKVFSKQVAFNFDNTLDDDGEDFAEIDPATGEVIEPLR
ncbi:hypothetical protein [Candidatus Soleaferrea massiliensis]|uniref:hypothetical protein n=1 Tax=Candidatus Soleaferrea massiliensis TaxID=1470354 RepID=UPI0005900AE5|nr:hypothetical protein [Candidatus Soleaferrea massiliensis]